MSEKEFLVEWKAPCGFDDWLLLSFYYLQWGEYIKKDTYREVECDKILFYHLKRRRISAVLAANGLSSVVVVFG